MVFSSTIFLFLFLPIFLAVYYVTPTRLKSLTIVVGSYIFYAWWRVDYLLLLIAITIWAYSIALLIDRSVQEVWRKRWTVIGITVSLLTLGYFKYANFALDSLNSVLGTTNHPIFHADHIILPIGISFFTFQAISYMVDIYRKDSRPARSLLDLAAFKALFPQLIAGPVIRYKDLDEQFAHRTHSVEKFGEGVVRFAQGFAMKVLIADTIAPMVEYCFAQPNPTTLDSWLGALAYTAQLYFDFAGYSSMAIGLGLMIGFRFIENFDQPYASRSITEFWRRWHISLSTWLRDYLYIPLGGNRGGSFATYRNLWLTMVLGGIWHGAAWTFVLWGIWHGSIMAIERGFGKGKGGQFFRSAAASWTLTFLLVVIGWVMFRAPSVETAFNVYRGMIGLHGWSLSPEVAWQVRGLQVAMLIAAYGIIFLGALRVWNVTLIRASWPRSPALVAASWGVLLVFSVAKLSADSFSPFLYFQF
ncbi:MAG: MBOAT family protein [Sphingobium sp.]|uniref:MBOAT family O-acyltransferase n=1 Tax=Sphingobium sp. TaxID=1912891 RepID=UPI0029A938F3|nr:MBOAT family protein [Sphingobium sp.]MDX3909065.1 MBOAT family protein [Sphingobium sp.]